MKIESKYGWKTDFRDCEYNDGFNTIEEAAQDIQRAYDEDAECFEDEFEENERNCVAIHAMYPFDMDDFIKRHIVDELPYLMEERLNELVANDVSISIDSNYYEAMFNAIKPIIDKHMSGLFDFAITQDPIAWYNPITKELKTEW